ncbi:MAG: ATP-binding cassette domain-containing protein, partial [Methanocorpusculum sp.]|nr:ATP-binding cassette domain-containing protein [Methanocorpusculum sp.]
MFEASFSKRLRDFSLNVEDFTVESGKTVGLIGENGSGKSTSLKIISGLMKPESGKIILDGDVLYDSSKRIFKDPEVRNIGYMFQNYALFPHMTARENISFGLKNKKMTKTDIKSRVDELVERMGIAEIENEAVTKMSGGQRQRTALARALAPRPSLLLLDEPLAALDVRTQEQMRRELASAIREEGTACILVTHSIID